MTNENSAPPAQAMMGMVNGFRITQLVYVAAKLGLADLVHKGPRTAAELAGLTHTHEPSLYRLLRGLASVGVFAVDAGGRFVLTPLAECLRDVPGSQRALAIMRGEEHYRVWAELLYSVETGKTAFEHVYGKPFFDYLGEHPQRARIFDAAMTGVHGHETQAMIDAYDFSTFGTLIDLGGGNGSLLGAVLKQHPRLQGILYDLPGTIARAQDNIRTLGLTARCRIVAGNFFESVPAAGDAYLMRHVIHDWDDDQATVILKNCRKAMSLSARLLLIECVISPGNDRDLGKLFDLNMLVLTGGMERTQSQYRVLFARGGFRLSRIVPTRANVSVIEGVPDLCE